MRCRYAMGVGAIVATVAASLIVVTAFADAPRSARILDGHSMAGLSMISGWMIPPFAGSSPVPR
jgi:hypothetical protein